MNFQFSIARLLLATAAFALVLGIMKPLKLAGNPLVWIAASAVAGIVLIASKDQFRFNGTIAIGLQIIIVSLFITMIYCRGPYNFPGHWQFHNDALEKAVEGLIPIFIFPLGYLSYDVIPGVFLIVANCYLWAQCVCWVAALFKIKKINNQPRPEDVVDYSKSQ